MNDYLDKFIIIFKLGIKDNNIIYEIDNIKENWNFKRNMKFIWTKLYYVNIRRIFQVK